MARSVAVFVVGALLAPFCPAARGEPPTLATVRGAEFVYMRRGPGTSHQAFRTVPRGAEVAVEAVEGSWTRVRTAEGESGYVNSAFLEIKSGAVPTAAGQEPSRGAPAEAAGATPPAAAPQAPADAKGKFVEEARAPANGVDPKTAPAPSEPQGDVRADVRRLLALTEEMHRQLSERGAPAPAPFSGGSRDAPGAATTLALTGAGLVVGFLIGTGYGRYQERNRRTRVRF